LDASKDLASVSDLTSWVAGTVNQITVTDDTDGTITLSTPQNIHTGASPTFIGLDLTGLTDGYIPYIGAAGFANSRFYTNGTNISIGTTTVDYPLKLYATGLNSTNVLHLHKEGSEAGTGYVGALVQTASKSLEYTIFDDGFTGVAEYTGKTVFAAGGSHLAIFAFTPGKEIQLYAGGRTSSDRIVTISPTGVVAAGDINVTGVYKVDGVQVVSNRVIDARCDDVINSGDATTDGVIDSLRDAMVTHGLIAAA